MRWFYITRQRRLPTGCLIETMLERSASSASLTLTQRKSQTSSLDLKHMDVLRAFALSVSKRDGPSDRPAVSGDLPAQLDPASCRSRGFSSILLHDASFIRYSTHQVSLFGTSVDEKDTITLRYSVVYPEMVQKLKTNPNKQYIMQAPRFYSLHVRQTCNSVLCNNRHRDHLLYHKATTHPFLAKVIQIDGQ